MGNFLAYDGASLARIKGLMSIAGSGITDDAVQVSTDVACALVEEKCGPVGPVVSQVDYIPSNSEGCLDARPTALTSIIGRSGAVYNIADFRVTGQWLVRKDGASWWEELTVTSSCGWAFGSAPVWAFTAALGIAVQHRRGLLIAGPGRSVPEGSGSLITAQVRTILQDHLLIGESL